MQQAGSTRTWRSAATASRPDHGRRGEGAQCRRENRDIDDDAIEELRNMCRCGTYNRIREAIKRAEKM